MSLEDLDDRELVREAKDGDSEAFDELVRRYQDRIFNLVRRKVRTREDAADVTQEVFVRAYKGLPKFRGDSKFYTWLFRIALNTSYTKRRRVGRRKEVVPASLDARQTDDDGALDPPDERRGPETLAEASEETRLVQEAIAALPDDKGDVILMKDLDGLRYKDIAEILDCPVGSVKSKVHRARKALKAELEKTLQPE